ncbi:MAG: ribosome recycling factor [Proteobacteria bacterium]|jgi:ribosome recycling factor|nr:ribosome recycling factor [Pseudomonadota bacterium]
MENDIKQNAERKMNKAIEVLKQDFAKIRTGRAHPSILDQISVDYHGTSLPINQVATVTLLDSQTISVTPWEKQMIPLIEKAILESNIGLNPASVGGLIRVPMPPLSQERRKELIKVVKSYSEDSKVSIRNVRRDANEASKKLLKKKEISSDEDKRSQDEIQKLTNEKIRIADQLLSAKENEIMTV